MKREHHKLVRDRVIEIIQAEGKECDFEYLPVEGERFLTALKAKLVEEAREVEMATSREQLLKELADVYEVLEWIQKEAGVAWEEVLAQKFQLRSARGGFLQRVFLHWVKEV